MLEQDPPLLFSCPEVLSKTSGIFADRRTVWKTSKESRIFPCSSNPVRNDSVWSVGSRSKGIGEAAQGVSAATAAAGHPTRGWNGKTATLKTIPVTELKPAAYNPRKKLKPGDKEYEKIKNSIQEFGFADPYREKIYRTRRWKNARCVCGA